jgi:hypothetical protein
MIVWERFVLVLAGGCRNLPGSSSFPSVTLSPSAGFEGLLFLALFSCAFGEEAS